MANNFTEIMSVVNAGNKMGLSNTITRDYGIPLDLTSIHNTYADAVRYAATDATAYQGQVIAAEGKVYVIVNDSQGNQSYGTDPETGKEITLPIYIKELTYSSTTSAIDARLQEVEKFFKVGSQESLKETLDTLIEIQDYIATHSDQFTGLLSDVGENREDINHIYSRWELDENGAYKRDASGNRIAKNPTGKLQDEINRATTAENVIYDADGGTNADGSKYETGLLPDEIARAIAAEQTIFHKDGGVDADGNKYDTGLLPDEIKRAQEKEQFILDLLFGQGSVTDGGYVSDIAEKVGTDEALVYGILGDFRNYDEETGEYQYDTLTDFIKNATSIATTDKFGGVLSSNPEVEDDQHKDLVEVVQIDEVEAGVSAGQMRVIDLNVNKLYQTAYLILDGGNAVDNPFGGSSQNPGLDNNPA